MDRYIGRLLDNRYEILEIIGTGGMAVVYKARCHRLNRLVAIKILKDEFSRDEEFRRRFHAEGEAVAMLSHPNIVAVYDVSTSDEADYIVMELIDGITLKQYMAKKGVLNWKETLHFAMQIAKALEHAHGRGIIHRDIKPHNVMVLKNGSVKVADFGIARVVSKSNTLTKEALGSVHYISPEQAKGSWVDNRSDLYSLSVVMYEMMAGRPPYDGESPVAVAIQHINGGAPLPSTLNPNIPRGLEQIIMKGMALDTKDRYFSATEMLRDMDDFRKDPTIIFGVQPPVVDEATKVIQTQQVMAEMARQPRTTAERVAGNSAGAGAAARARTSNQTQRPRSADTPRNTAGTRSTGTAPRTTGGVPRTTGGVPRSTGSIPRTTGNVPRSASSAEAARRAAASRSGQPRRRSREEIEAEERRNKMATIAVVACSVVAIIAIIIFLVVIFNGGVGDKNKLVPVPNLEGKTYANLPDYPEFEIELAGSQYDEQYEKGQVISQTPEADTKVAAGSVIKVTVSLGEEPLVKTMDDLSGVKEADAIAHLKGQGVVPLSKPEASDEVEEGRVIRTDPEASTELQEGQTVTIYVSTGPTTQKAKMPNVKGRQYDVAYKMLTDAGFTNVNPKEAYSEEDKEEVIDQNIPYNTEIDVTTEIILTVSKGPEPTEPPTEKPTEKPTEAPTDPPEPEEITRHVTFDLPADMKENYVLGLYKGGNPVLEPTEVVAGTKEITVELTGSGVQSYDLYINDEFYKTEKVDFTVNG